MSDVSQGEGWWEASDGKWYPPEAVPGPGPGADPELTQRWERDPTAGGPSAAGPAPFEPPSPAAGGPGPGSPPPGYGAPNPGQPPSFGAPAPGPGIPPGAAPSYGPQGYAPGPGPGYPPPGGAGPGTPPGYGQSPAFGAPGAGAYGGVAAPAKKSNRTAWIILGSIVGGIVLLCGGCVAIVAVTGDSVDDFSASEVVTEAAYDFSAAEIALGPSSCEVTGTQIDDDYAVDAIITSQGDVRSHFRLDYEIIDPSGVVLGSDFGIISDVDPGETVRDGTFGVIGGVPDWTDVTCEVTSTVRIVA